MTEQAEGVVWICAHVEPMAETTDYVSIPRVEWDAMTETERDTALSDIAMEVMSNAGGCGAHVVDASEVPGSYR